MGIIEEMMAKFKERYENDRELQEFAAQLKAKAEAEKKAREEAQARFAEMFKVSVAEAEADETEAEAGKDVEEQAGAATQERYDELFVGAETEVMGR